MASGDTLMALWLHNKSTTRPIGEIVEEARAGKLPGVAPLPSGHGFQVIDEQQALAANRQFFLLASQHVDGLSSPATVMEELARIVTEQAGGGK